MHFRARWPRDSYGASRGGGQARCGQCNVSEFAPLTVCRLNFESSVSNWEEPILADERLIALRRALAVSSRRAVLMRRTMKVERRFER